MMKSETFLSRGGGVTKKKRVRSQKKEKKKGGNKGGKRKMTERKRSNITNQYHLSKNHGPHQKRGSGLPATSGVMSKASRRGPVEKAVTCPCARSDRGFHAEMDFRCQARAAIQAPLRRPKLVGTRRRKPPGFFLPREGFGSGVASRVCRRLKPSL